MSTLTPALLQELKTYIDSRLIREEPPEVGVCFDAQALPTVSSAPRMHREKRADRIRANRVPEACGAAPSRRELEQALSQLDESFSEMLLRKIDEAGITDAACYKKARVDRKLFSKIRSNRLYRPAKVTAVAFALALELPLPEARDMLSKAGYSLSRSSVFDLILEFFISRGTYDIDEINLALYQYDQPLIGA